MSVANELLSDGFDRVRETVHEVVSGLDEDRLGFRPHDHGNSIGWLVWHLTRVQDLASLAVQRVNRTLSPSECERHLHQSNCPPPGRLFQR